jgi:signal transduction histidine kinase
MRWPLGQMWHRSRVSTRIAAAIVIALVSVLGLAIVQVLLTPEPQYTIYGLQSVVTASEEAAAAAFTRAPEHRNDALQALPAARWLSLSWQRETPQLATENAQDLFSERLEATLAEALRTRVKSIAVAFAWPSGRGDVVFRPPEIESLVRSGLPRGKEPVDSAAGQSGLSPAPLPDSPPRRAVGLGSPAAEEPMPTGPLRQGEPEMPIPGLFSIAIQGLDGTWLIVTSSQHQEASPLWRSLLHEEWREHVGLLPLIGGTLVIAGLSAFTARRILKPLEELTAAAQRVGTERNPAPIASTGLGEFSVIADAFNDMQARLERFIGDRTQMLAAVSHDLRTSLTRLKLAIEDLEDGEQKRVMAKETDDMDAMISATLSFAHADAKAEASRDIDVASLLISLCDEASDCGGYAEYQGPNHARLRCQPIAMKRALTNIIDNAVKYGQRAHVSLEMTAASAIIRVGDEGPGIAPEEREESFAPFRRLEASRNRSTGGVGLGLTIARDVVQAHGGTIGLADGEPCGLVVTVSLPASQSVLRA